MKKSIYTKIDLLLFITFIVLTLLIILDFVYLMQGATLTALGLFIFFVKTVVASFIFDYFFDNQDK